MSRTWIIYNKPEEPNSTHAGLLLALGLQGYHQVLTITEIYQYFAQEHESTTVGRGINAWSGCIIQGAMHPAILKVFKRNGKEMQCFPKVVRFRVFHGYIWETPQTSLRQSISGQHAEFLLSDSSLVFEGPTTKTQYLDKIAVTVFVSSIFPSLFVHIPARHSSSYVELELPNLLQGEIGRRSGGDNVLEREGYAVSA